MPWFNLDSLLHNLDPVVTFFRAVQMCIATGVVWLIVRFIRLGKHILAGADREKSLQEQLKKATDEIVALYDRIDEGRVTTNHLRDELKRVLIRMDTFDEKAEVALEENGRLKARVTHLEAILAKHGIREDLDG